MTQKRGSEGFRVAMFVGLALFLLLFPLRRVHAQYFMPALPLLSIGGAWLLAGVFQAARARPLLKLAVIALLLAQPLLYYRADQYGIGSNRKQLKNIQRILDIASPSDAMLDGGPAFNLFHRDLHYFWYSVKPDRGLEAYNRLTNNRYRTLDLATLVRQKKPAVISDYLLNVREAGFERSYVPTKEGYYIRKDLYNRENGGKKSR